MTETRVFNKQGSFINLVTGKYPINFETMQASSGGLLFGRKTAWAVLEHIKHAEVMLVEKPEGDVVEQGPAELRDGVYYQTWTVRAFTPEELAEKLSEKKSELLLFAGSIALKCRERGATYDFGGATGINHVQLREVDVSNLTGLGLKARSDIDRQYYFRSYENTVIPLTGPETVALTDFAFESFEVFLGVYWGLQAMISGSSSLATLPSEEAIEGVLWGSVGGK